MDWVRRWRALLDRGGRPSVTEVDRAARAIGTKAQKLQALGRRYGLVRIEELRRLRSEGQLIPQGTPVTRAIASSDAREAAQQGHR